MLACYMKVGPLQAMIHMRIGHCRLQLADPFAGFLQFGYSPRGGAMVTDDPRNRR